MQRLASEIRTIGELLGDASLRRYMVSRGYERGYEQLAAGCH
jgi:hypothetical protein